MNVYLDNNIVVAIEKAENNLDNIRALLPDEEIRFFYSSAHIFEIEHFKGSTTVSKQELLSQRFDTIRRIFENNYIFLDLYNSTLVQQIEDPENVYETITYFPFAINAIKGFVNIFTKEQKEEVRRQLGLETYRINNCSSKEVIAHLDTKLTIWGTNQSFLDIVESAGKHYPDKRYFGLHNRIAVIFELLDMLGFWKDKETETSNYARLWDADHSFFASCCDYFISDDKRTRNKARVAFDIYSKKTKVISSQGKV